jgi:hypothetical protein
VLVDLARRFCSSVQEVRLMALDPDLIRVIQAINAGDKALARRLIQPLLRNQPSAEAWYQASRLTETPEHERVCLQRALGYDPYHADARRRLSALQPPAPTSPAPPARQSAAAPQPGLAEQPAPPLIPLDQPLKKARARRKRGLRFYVILGSVLLLSLSSSFFVLWVLGSPFASQLKNLLGGPQPVVEIDGVPLERVPDAVYRVEPNSVAPLSRAEPLAGVLEHGLTHDYTFSVSAGEEIAIGVQFFSPMAQRVNRNLAIFGPDGRDAEAHCQRERILQGDSGAAIVCLAHQSGLWHVRLLGRSDESVCAYVVTVTALR